MLFALISKSPCIPLCVGVNSETLCLVTSSWGTRNDPQGRVIITLFSISWSVTTAAADATLARGQRVASCPPPFLPPACLSFLPLFLVSPSAPPSPFCALVLCFVYSCIFFLYILPLASLPSASLSLLRFAFLSLASLSLLSFLFLPCPKYLQQPFRAVVVIILTSSCLCEPTKAVAIYSL